MQCCAKNSRFPQQSGVGVKQLQDGSVLFSFDGEGASSLDQTESKSPADQSTAQSAVDQLNQAESSQHSETINSSNSLDLDSGASPDAAARPPDRTADQSTQGIPTATVAPADNSTSAKLSETDSQTVQSVSEPPEPKVFGAFTVADLQDMQKLTLQTLCSDRGLIIPESITQTEDIIAHIMASVNSNSSTSSTDRGTGGGRKPVVEANDEDSKGRVPKASRGDRTSGKKKKKNSRSSTISSRSSSGGSTDEFNAASSTDDSGCTAVTVSPTGDTSAESADDVTVSQDPLRVEQHSSMGVETKESLEGKTVRQLHEICRANGIKNASKLNKAPLIEMMLQMLG